MLSIGTHNVSTQSSIIGTNGVSDYLGFGNWISYNFLGSSTKFENTWSFDNGSGPAF